MGAPKIKDLPGNWNRIWGRGPIADYLDYGTIYPQKVNQAKSHWIKAQQDFRDHPARNKAELGEPPDAPFVVPKDKQQKTTNPQRSSR